MGEEPTLRFEKGVCATLAVCCLFCAAEAAEVTKGSVPGRSETDPAFQWKLSDIYSDDAAWNKAYDELAAMLPKMAALQGRLGESAAVLLEALKLEDEIGERIGKVYAYAHMKSHEDTANNTYQGLADRATTLSVQVGSTLSFVTPELLAIPGEKIAAFLKEEKGLDVYRFALDRITRVRDHVLPVEQELLLARMGNVADGPDNIFSMLTNADMTFPVISDEQGEDVELTEERYTRFIHSPNRNVRKAAFQGILSTYAKYRNTLAATYATSVKKDHFFAETRKYASCVDAALFPNAIPASVYENAVKAVHDNLEPLHRYMKLKKKVLELSELHLYDLYAPMAPEKIKDISFDDAKKAVFEAVKPLGEKYTAKLQEGLDSGWIDVYENKGKRSGAYSWGTYGVHPFVLLNYNGTRRDVFTLAHEMGHALHSAFTFETQPYVYSGHAIFTAEVASISNELLLLDHLLSKAATKDEKIELLVHALEQIRTTVYRQLLFAEFELATHRKVEAGEPLTSEVLSSLWHDLYVLYYGPGAIIDKEIDMEWARIPHFYSAFYVYQYATGYAAAATLVDRIRTEGASAVEKYLGFLSRGDSAYPIDLLKDAGVDMASAEPMRAVAARFSKWLDELEALLNEK